MRTLLFTYIILLFAVNASLGQATIVVKNDPMPEEILLQAKHYADIFGFKDDVLIVISFSHSVSKINSGYTLYQNVQHLGGGHQVHIIISKREDRNFQFYTLAHEMVHAQQFVEGKLVKCGDSFFSWKGDKCLNTRYIAYHHRPWEKEAHKLGTKLYQEYRKTKQMLASH
ncbi:hypothetical protein [Catalinimonas alkaloidigena]|uniref:hypothetical protein n=1 Tax=Catalinimonas alkaloidigena TaxID=1075417 RepID=UPI0024074FD8|nr:hypothetical protein [Catalinimonas alkaloidigena]